MAEAIKPTLVITGGKKLIGIKQIMSLSNNLTGELWKAFMQKHATLLHPVSADRFSLQVYPANYFELFDPSTIFEKWALVEVADFEETHKGFEQFTLPSGLYAVFHYKGLSTDPSIFQYIFTEWLPQSGYILDNRPHFEVLGKLYRNNDPKSEEDIWIPVKTALNS